MNSQPLSVLLMQPHQVAYSTLQHVLLQAKAFSTLGIIPSCINSFQADLTLP